MSGILVIGGGIGGLTLALCLHRNGIPCTVVEAAAEMRPPDVILREVFLRTGDRPFARVENVMSREEMLAITGGYKQVAGHDLDTLKAKAGAA